MSSQVDQQRIDKFKEDRQRLPYNDAILAQRMGVNKSNYSSYINGRKRITEAFLRKFYLAFGEELNPIREDQMEFQETFHTYNRIEKNHHLETHQLLTTLLENQNLLAQDVQLMREQVNRLNDQIDNYFNIQPVKDKKKPGG
ncbi:MAG TPA: helix-turn-helix transcriptional regulator [Puia sp.]